MHQRQLQGAPVPKSVIPAFTKRELQILLSLSRGRTDREIATVLMLSPRTVEHHVERVVRKLDANNRAHAVAIAISLNLISLD